MDGLEEQTRRNLGWFYFEALKSIAQRGRWPDSLSPRERRNLRDEKLVELVYVPRTGWQPRVKKT